MRKEAMTTAQTPTQLLDAVHGLADSVRSRADEIEQARCLPVDLYDELKAAGVWRMLVPRSHGGEEVGLITSMEVLETLSMADGATGWTSMIGIETPQMTSLLPRETYDALYAETPDVTAGGSFAPVGTAVPVDGGYRVTGRWPFASGCERWDWLFGNCMVIEDGEPRRGPDGEPVSRAMLFEPEQGEIHDTWHVLGLRGTGSHHIAVTELFVPEARSFDIFSGQPCVTGVARFPIIDFHFHITTVALGIAGAALDEAVESATRKQRMSMRTSLAKTPLMQYRLGHAAVTLRAARTLLFAEAERAAESMARGEEDFLTLAVRVWANNSWVAQRCVEVVDTCYTINGTSGVYDGRSPLQRYLRDVHTISQHASLNENSITRAGAALLGEPVDMQF
jgi:alkylation response protein AidB-like acyl-CoA dehydrogenase